MYLEWVFAFFQNQKTTTAIPDSNGRRKARPKKFKISEYSLTAASDFHFNLERFCLTSIYLTFNVCKGTCFTSEGPNRSHRSHLKSNLNLLLIFI